MGFLNRACMAIPPNARDAPASAAPNILGARVSLTRVSVPHPTFDPNRDWKTSDRGRLTDPMDMQMKYPAIDPTIRTITVSSALAFLLLFASSACVRSIRSRSRCRHSHLLIV